MSKCDSMKTVAIYVRYGVLYCMYLIINDYVLSLLPRSTMASALDTIAGHGCVAALTWYIGITLYNTSRGSIHIDYDDHSRIIINGEEADEQRVISDNNLNEQSNPPYYVSPTSYVSALLTGAISISMDIDHFVQARTLSLVSASSMHERAFFHNVTAILIASSCVHIFQRCLTSQWLQCRKNTILNIFLMPHIIAMVCIGWGTHQLRDSLRRGLAPFPFTTFAVTPPIPYLLYLIIMITMPLVVTTYLGRCYYGYKKEYFYNAGFTKTGEGQVKSNQNIENV